MPSKVNLPQEDELLKVYDEVFTGLGCLPGEHKIEIDHSFTLVVHPPRKVPLALKEQIKEELERMGNACFVVKQTEPTAWLQSLLIPDEGPRLETSNLIFRLGSESIH